MNEHLTDTILKFSGEGGGDDGRLNQDDRHGRECR